MSGALTATSSCTLTWLERRTRNLASLPIISAVCGRGDGKFAAAEQPVL
jgi:hypothetical protein